MEITKKHWVIAGTSFLIAIVVATATWVFFPRRAVAPQPVGTEPTPTETSTTTPAVSEMKESSPTSSAPELVAIAKGDTIASWNFKGVYADTPELVAKTEIEISTFSTLLETATSSRMNLLVGIANDYDLLGDGRLEYDYLSRAIAVGGQTGLPWHNLGVLMEKLGAYETARVAYQKATLVQPQLKQWHLAYIEFLTTRMNGDVTDIEKAFGAALANLGQDSEILSMQAAWKAS